MKHKVLLFVAAILFAVGMADAKPKKIKYGKHVYYEGEVVNKQPMGAGSLVLLSPTNKKERVATIAGEFKANKIFNAEITSSLLPAIKTIGEMPIKYYIQDKANKTVSVSFDFSLVSFIEGSSEYTFQGLDLSLLISGKEWTMALRAYPLLLDGDKEPVSFTDKVFATVKTYPIPKKIANYWNSVDNVCMWFSLSGGNLQLQEPVYYEFGNVIYRCNSDSFRTYHQINNNLKRADGQSEFEIINNQTWRGKRTLEDNTIINSSEIGVTVTNADIASLYVGTLMDSMQPVSQTLKSINELKFKDGLLHLRDKSIMYINGEPKDTIKKRLKDQGMDSDLIDQVIARDISEADAVAKQQQREEEKKRQQREEEKKRQAEKRKEEFAKHWKGSEVLFQGTLTGTDSGNQVFGMLFGIDNTYFEGTAMLYINNSGEARFVVAAEPGSKAYSQGRGRALQVLDFCKEINEDVSGPWSIDGDQLYIDGKDASIKVSADFKTFTYTGMLGSKMTLKKQH